MTKTLTDKRLRLWHLRQVLYHFQIELSDIDRGIYESLDYRLAQHPSETGPYLLTRALAYALSYQEGLEFSPGGLSDPEQPAMRGLGVHGVTDLWIEIGNPSARKLHKATKAAKNVVVYTYKSAKVLVDEIRENNVHRANEIKIFSFDQKFLAQLELMLSKNNRWSLLVQNGSLDIGSEGKSVTGELQKFYL